MRGKKYWVCMSGEIFARIIFETPERAQNLLSITSGPFRSLKEARLYVLERLALQHLLLIETRKYLKSLKSKDFK
jgi:hypothetical protein